MNSFFATSVVKKKKQYYSQGDWPEGYRLATSIQFRFPECQKVEVNSLIPRATENGVHLLQMCLQWDSERRPSAQQALKYNFFQLPKRGSDPVHSVSLAAKLQQQLITRHEVYADDHKSHLSLNEGKRHFNDMTSNNGPVDQTSALHHIYTNGVNVSENTGIYSSDSPKWTKPNGINSFLNGDFTNGYSSLNNNYQLKKSGRNSNMHNKDMEFLQKSLAIQPKYKTENSKVLKESKSFFDDSEHDNAVRRNLHNEKINEIFVNRNLDKIYDDYNGLNGWQEGVPQKSKTFFLHENPLLKNKKESKIYDIFSKQRVNNSSKTAQSKEHCDDYIQDMMAKSNGSKMHLNHRISVLDEKSQSFEDKELDKLLGYVVMTSD